MKHFVKFFVVTFFLLFCTDVIAEQKIVVLDLSYVLNNSKAGKNAQDFLKESYNNNLKKYADMEKALKEEEQNEALFSYIEAALNWLDISQDYSNFHLLFLLKLTKYLGFYPDTTHMDLSYFNLVEGAFDFNKTHEQFILGEDLDLFKTLLGTNFDALDAIKMSSNQRQRFLIILLKYYELHLIGFKKPKSLQILNEVFN